MIVELDAEASPAGQAGEPLRWLMHAGPGTGKSHVINVIKNDLFKNVLGWDIGVQFQVVALQAVMADLLGGDTTHHACGIPAFKKFESRDEELQKHAEVAKRVLQWRWRIIDEISMVSAKLLAEVDMKLRGIVRDIGTLKLKNGYTRPFGGLNVVCVVEISGSRIHQVAVSLEPSPRSTFRQLANISRHQAYHMGNLSYGVGRSMACKALQN